MEPGGQTAVMDEADTALTFATREQRVLRAAFWCPAESTFAFGIFDGSVFELGLNIDIFFKVFLVRVSEKAIGAMTLFFFSLTVYVHLLRQDADFLDSELYSANLKDISFLDLVVLLMKYKRLLNAGYTDFSDNTYDFLVVDL